MSDTFRRFTYRLLALGFFAVLLAAGFWGGFELGRARVGSSVVPELAALEGRYAECAAERDRLRGDLTALDQQRIMLERTAQIERETNRSLADQLKQAQDERLSLSKEGSYLRRLIQEGGKGAVRIHDLRLSTEKTPRTFHYAFTVTQLVQDFGTAKGRVEIHVDGQQDGEPVRLPLDQLPDADPKQHTMDFEYFQNIQGTVVLPDGFEPRSLVVEIKPDNEQLIPTSESFPWTPESS